MTDFELFQAEFQKWQERFGLNGYKVYFKEENLTNAFANITVDQENMVATVRLNRKCPASDVPFKNVARTAKHEAIHLLLFKLEDRACSRYVRDGEIYEAAEELVFKLEKLIPDKES